MKIEDNGALFHKYISHLDDLESGSSSFCEKLLSGNVVEYEVFDAWRQKIIMKIQNVDTELHRYLSSTGNGLSIEECLELEAFKTLQKESVSRILQTDAVILSFTEKQLDEIREVLSNLTHGRRALQRYGASGPSSALVLDHDA
jgi:hypothetical protein